MAHSWIQHFVFFFMKIGKIIDICDMIPRFGCVQGTLPLLLRRRGVAAYQRLNQLLDILTILCYNVPISDMKGAAW